MTSPRDDGEWVATPALVIRLGTLETGLRQAVADLEVAKTPLERRDAIRRSLSDVVDFIRSFHPNHNPILAAPLVELFAALMDLDRGKQQEILTPAPVAHRPLDALPRGHIKAYAAATLDRLLSTGMSRKDAATRVAQLLKQRGYYLDGRRGAPTAATVLKWRDQHTGHSGEAVGPRAFRQLRPALDQRSGEDALAQLDAFLARVIPKNPPLLIGTSRPQDASTRHTIAGTTGGTL